MNLSFALQSVPVVSPDINFSIILPEIIVTVAGLLVMLIDAFQKNENEHRYTGGVSIIGLLAAAVACVWLWTTAGDATMAREAFNGMIVTDTLRLSFTLVFLIVSILTVLISMIWVKWENLPAGEFHCLLLFATVGMMLMAGGGDLVIIFLGLEILSIATYVLCGFRRTDLRSNESALKYFILGSFSSAFLLYGIALIYGATATVSGGQIVAAGTTNIREIAARLDGAIYPPLLFAGAAMMLVGFGFKIATAPFHVWTPDVYEGAPTPVTAFLATGSKAAGFAAFMRVFLIGFPAVTVTGAVAAGDVAGQTHAAWMGALAVLAVLTMVIGNVVAIVQTNVKRMLAYSSIAHAGYALLGFIAAGAATDARGRDEAIAATVFYLLTYAVMNLGAFAVVTLIARSGDRRTEYEDYTGIGFRAPILSFALSLFLLSLLGAPLTAGFMGKIAVFSEALKHGYGWLVVVGVINTAISVYYYLGLVVVMFFRERTTEWSAPRVPAGLAVALVLTVIGTFYLGIFPGRVLDAFRAAVPSASVRVGSR